MYRPVGWSYKQASFTSQYSATYIHFKLRRHKNIFKKVRTPGNTQGPSYRARLALSQKVPRKLKTEFT